MIKHPKLPVRWRSQAYEVEQVTAPEVVQNDDRTYGEIIRASQTGMKIQFYPAPRDGLSGTVAWEVQVYFNGRFYRSFGSSQSVLEAINVAEQLASFFPNSYVVDEQFRTSTTPLNPLKGSELMEEIEPQQWLVPGWIPAEEVVLLSGDGGVNKSTVAQQLCTAAALGRPWLGLPVSQGRAMFLTAEDDMKTVNRRQLAINQAEGVSLSALDNVDFISLAGRASLLGTLDHDSSTIQPTMLFEQIEQHVEETAPAVIVLDTVAGLFGGQENDRNHTRQFVQLMYRLVLAHRSTVILIAHPSLSGMASGSGLSGSTDWHNAVRARLYLERVMVGPDKAGRMIEPDTDARLISTKKLQYGPKVKGGTRLRFQKGILVPDHQFALPAPAQAAAIVSADEIEAKFLSLLVAFTVEGQNVSNAGPKYAPAKFAKDPRADGIRKSAFAEAMARLFTQERISMVPYGPPAKGSRRIEVTK